MFGLKAKKLMKLDYGDRLKLKRLLKEQIAILDYLNHWQGATCSQVLENLGIMAPITENSYDT